MTTSGNDGACGRAFMAQTGRFGFRFHVITSCWCVLSGAPPVVGRAQRRHASAGAEDGASHDLECCVLLIERAHKICYYLFYSTFNSFEGRKLSIIAIISKNPLKLSFVA